jgi:hypothetical protein
VDMRGLAAETVRAAFKEMEAVASQIVHRALALLPLNRADAKRRCWGTPMPRRWPSLRRFLGERCAPGWSVVAFSCAIAMAGLVIAAPVPAFPPYRTTDADTAEPHALELRIGMQAARSDGITELLAPRVRANIRHYRR